MSKPVDFYSDLDLTLIYSQRTMNKHHNTLYHSITIEVHENKPLSYMRMNTWMKFKRILEENVTFIPVTTRTFEQYRRVNIPEIHPRNAVVLSGAQIITDDVENLEWKHHIHTEINKLNAPPTEVYGNIKTEILNIPGVNKVRCAENAFIYVVKDEAENTQLAERFQQLSEQTGYIVSHQGRKSYLVPPCVDKGKAVTYLREENPKTTAVGAGDSVLDLSIQNAVDVFIQPRHGEAVGRTTEAIITEHSGIEAVDDMLNIIAQHM